MVDAYGRQEAAGINRALVQADQDIFHMTLERLTLGRHLSQNDRTRPAGRSASMKALLRALGAETLKIKRTLSPVANPDWTAGGRRF